MMLATSPACHFPPHRLIGGPILRQRSTPNFLQRRKPHDLRRRATHDVHDHNLAEAGKF